MMPGSVTQIFTEPEDFEAALRSEGCLGLLITGRGLFRAELTQIVLRSFRLSAGDEQLSRIAFIAVPAGMVLILFPVGSGAMPTYGGIEMRLGEIMTLSPGEQVHARTEGHRRWGVILLPVEQLIEYGRALTGGAFSIPPVAQRWRPPPTAGRDLRGLHAAAIRMVATQPQLFVDTQAAHGLEQQLIHAIVHCLSAGSTDLGSATARRHQDIMAHFERLLQSQPDQDMRMTEICAELGVSQRLLRSLCTKHLGMSPTSYGRRHRMSLARRALQRADGEGARISEIARRYGFRSPGPFAVNYRAAFGESPSSTLRRGHIR